GDPGKHGTLRASFTNEVMDVYSVNVSASHFMSESQRKALSDDIFGGTPPSSARPPSAPPPADEELGPISSDHIPLAQWQAQTQNPPGSAEFLGPESTRKPPKTVRDASQWPRGKFAEVEGIPIVGD